MSINIPTTIKIIFIRRRITYLFVEMDIIPVEIAAGIPEYAITKDIAEDAEIRNRIIPLVQALLTRIFRSTAMVVCRSRSVTAMEQIPS